MSAEVPAVWWSPGIGLIEQVGIVGDEAQLRCLNADEPDLLLHRLPTDAIELAAAPTEAECDVAYAQDTAVKAVVHWWGQTPFGTKEHFPVVLVAALNALARTHGEAP